MDSSVCYLLCQEGGDIWGLHKGLDPDQVPRGIGRQFHLEVLLLAGVHGLSVHVLESLEEVGDGGVHGAIGKVGAGLGVGVDKVVEVGTQAGEDMRKSRNFFKSSRSIFRLFFERKYVIQNSLSKS